MKKLLAIILIFVLMLLVIPTNTVFAYSGSSGDFKYEVYGGRTTITRVNKSIKGHVSTPWVLGEYRVYYIGMSAFSGCTGMESVLIADGVEDISSDAFHNCTSLKYVYLPDTLMSMGFSVFSGCTSLISVDIPDNVKYINDYTFLNCTSLTSIIIPENVTSIGDYAFSNCTSLESIIIPNSVTSIGDKAFENCDLLTIYCSKGSKAENEAKLRGIDYKPICTYTDTYGEMIKEHNYSSATCTKPKTCIECGDTSGSENGHKSDSGTVTKEANCFETGIKTYKCTVCFDTVKTETIAISHDYQDATCTMPKTCAVCGVTIGDKAIHKLNSGSETKKATCITTGTKTYKCTECFDPVKTETIAKIAHDYKAATCTSAKKCKVCGTTSGKSLGHDYETKYKKATTSKNGKSYKQCERCDKITSEKTIYKIKSIKLSTTEYTYNGKAKKPSVKVKDSKGNTISSKYYTVSYASGRKNVGRYKVTVKFKTKYSGSKTLYFEINPKKTSVSKVTAAKKSLKIKIKKQSTQVTGYQIQYSTSKKFKSAKTKTIKSYKTTSATIKSLKAKKTYYVRVRTYKTVNGKKYYSAWSSAKSKKTK